MFIAAPCGDHEPIPLPDIKRRHRGALSNAMKGWVPMSWNWNDIENNKPTVADDRTAAVDDGEVIDKTARDVPAQAHAHAHPRVHRLRSQLDQAAQAARGHVAQHPLSATLVAAAGAALVTGLLFALGRQQSQVQGLSKLRRTAVARMPWLAR